MTFLELSLSGGVFILVIVAFRALALRRLPKGTFVALWWLAAARLLLPLELPSRFSVYTLLESLRPQAAAPALPPALAAPMAPAAPPVLIVPTQPVAAPPAPAPFPVWTALWLSVGLLLAAWFLIRYVRWRRRFRESLPVDCPGLDAWFRRRVEVRVTDQIAAPLTYGLLRPVVLLPGNMDLTDEEALTCVLAHERAHIRWLDGLLKLLLTAALCLHWFNPSAWILYVLGNRDMELRCDEAAVLALGEDSRERYALALIRLAENKHVPLCGFAHRNGMEERIKAIMSVKRKSLLACFIALALVLGITTAFATSAKPTEPDGPSWNGDMTDRELYAEVSAESAAQWDEVLAPYEPFGLKWTFDDPDLDGNGLTMTWEGHEVSGIYDEKQSLWITEHTGNGTFGPDAVELYVVYEGKERTGLRLATEEEQARFTRDRKLSSDALKVQTLVESVRYDSGHIYFTIPESGEHWSIFIRGRVLLEDGSGMSVHYLEEESEQGEWIPQMTYSFEVGDAAFDELTMDVKYGDATYCCPLTLLLPEGKADVPEDGSMVWPVDGGTVSQAQQTRTNSETGEAVPHNGVDIAVETGTPVYAAGKGTVKEAGFNATDGNFVRIDHGRGQETFYAHCASVLVKTGDAVTRGQTIATVGSTGQSTGPHLHFELLVNGVAQDPERYFAQAAAFAGAVGKEGNADLPVGIPEEKPDGKAEGNALEVTDRQTEDYEKFGVAFTDSKRCFFGGRQVKIFMDQDGALVTDPEGDVYIKTIRDANGQLTGVTYMTEAEVGERFGASAAADIAVRYPDLEAAIGTEGEEGYISTAEDSTWALCGDDTEEHNACYDWIEENNVNGFIIPLYDKDHQVIGEFQIGIGNGNRRDGVVKTFEEMMEAKAQGWPCKNKGTPVEKEPIFKSLEEAREAVRNGWVGDMYSGYYEN